MTETNSFPRLLAVTAIILNQKGQIFLTLRDEEPDRNTWQLIGGYIRPGERLVEAVKRQIAEKAGITDLQEITFTGKYYDDPNRHPNKLCIPFLFQVKVQDAVAIQTTHTYQWFNPQEIESLPMALDNKQMLRDCNII